MRLKYIYKDRKIFQQIKIAVGEEFIRSQRNKRETPIDSDEEEGGEDIEDEIIEANEEEEQRYILTLSLFFILNYLKNNYYYHMLNYLVEHE